MTGFGRRISYVLILSRPKAESKDDDNDDWHR